MYFRMHDYNGDYKLDGLELYSSVMHDYIEKAGPNMHDIVKRYKVQAMCKFIISR